MDLRDLLVTENTKKNLEEYGTFDNLLNYLKNLKKQSQNDSEKKLIEENIKIVNQNKRNYMKQFEYTKNPLIHEFETETPKDIRACAVKRCCDAYKTGFTNLKKGNIKYFNMKFKKKTDPIQSIELTPKLISIKDGNIKILPEYFKEDCYLKIHKKTSKKFKKLNYKINHNVDIVRRYKEYYLHLTIDIKPKTSELKTIAGVDLGIRTFATVYSFNNETTIIKEYKHRLELLKKLNMKLNLLKTLKRKRKKQLTKIDKKKINIVNKLHWNFINDLVSENDIIYMGDIKSHDIVKDGKSKMLNVAFNDLKFFQLKQRLLYKAYIAGKKVIYVPEHYTTKTCSSCGTINNNVGSKEIFECDKCKLITGRDMNASKNMIIKGML